MCLMGTMCACELRSSSLKRAETSYMMINGRSANGPHCQLTKMTYNSRSSSQRRREPSERLFDSHLSPSSTETITERSYRALKCFPSNLATTSRSGDCVNVPSYATRDSNLLFKVAMSENEDLRSPLDIEEPCR